MLAEARCKASRDQVTTYAMRVVSNYASIGKDAGSSEIKLRNRLVSVGARNLLMSGVTAAEWTSLTINEHPMPLRETWHWIIENASDLQTVDLWQHFVNNRMVTISIEEGKFLTAMGLRSRSGGGDRYRRVGLEVCLLDDEPGVTLKVGRRVKL